jgi:ABC-type Fe3+-hydroxamate transport system substrate-binding protein
MSGARIVSLVPSITELLFDLGLGESVVGRTGFCVHPRAALRDVPKVGGTKDVDVERVRSLAPTHVIANVDENLKATVERIAEFVPRVIVTHPLAVDDNFDLYRTLGDEFGAARRATLLGDRLGAEIERTRAQAYAARRVLYLIWRGPWMTVSPQTYIASALAAVGLRAVQPAGASRYPVVDDAFLRDARFDAVLLSSEPFRFTAAHASEMRADSRLAGRAVLPIDGEMASWYGSRAIPALRYLREFRQAFDAACASVAAAATASR